MKRLVFLIAIAACTYAFAKKPRKHRAVDVSVDAAKFVSLHISYTARGDLEAFACFKIDAPTKSECVKVDPKPAMAWINGDVAEKWKDANE